MFLFEYKDMIISNTDFENVISISDFYSFCGPFKNHNYNNQTDRYRLFYYLTKDGYKLKKKMGNNKTGTLRKDLLWYMIRDNKIKCTCGKGLDVIGIKRTKKKFRTGKKNKQKIEKQYQHHYLYTYEPLTVNYINGKWEIEKLTADHIIPKSKGGNNSHDNIQLMCKKCNEIKGDKQW